MKVIIVTGLVLVLTQVAFAIDGGSKSTATAPTVESTEALPDTTGAIDTTRVTTTDSSTQVGRVAKKTKSRHTVIRRSEANSGGTESKTIDQSRTDESKSTTEQVNPE